MVEIRFELGNDRIPDDCYVMVRLDGKQKVARISGTQCVYRFPQKNEATDHRVGVVELFRCVGSCEVDLNPTLGSRKVHIQCNEAGLQDLCMHIVLDANSETSATPSAEHAKNKKAEQKNNLKQAARDYLARHQVELQLSRVLRAVLAVQPEDPKAFMAEKLLAYSGTQCMGGIFSDNRLHLSQPPAAAGAGFAAARSLTSPKHKKWSVSEFHPRDIKMMPADAWAHIYSQYPKQPVDTPGSLPSGSSNQQLARDGCLPSNACSEPDYQSKKEVQIEVEDVLHLTEEDAEFDNCIEADARLLAQGLLKSTTHSPSLPSGPDYSSKQLASPETSTSVKKMSPRKFTFANTFGQDEKETLQAVSQDENTYYRPFSQDEMEIEVEYVLHLAEEDELLEERAEADACSAAQQLLKYAIDSRF